MRDWDNQSVAKFHFINLPFVWDGKVVFFFLCVIEFETIGAYEVRSIPMAQRIVSVIFIGTWVYVRMNWIVSK